MDLPTKFGRIYPQMPLDKTPVPPLLSPHGHPPRLDTEPIELSRARHGAPGLGLALQPAPTSAVRRPVVQAAVLRRRRHPCAPVLLPPGGTASLLATCCLAFRRLVLGYFCTTICRTEQDWNDENTRLVCELFAEQVTAHNRSGTHLNKSGYKNVMEKFKDKTGLDYSRRQFKNKWDKMRREYANWKRLVKETGLGWDNEKKTYTAPDSRWKQLNKDYPGINKFKDGPLQFEELKTIMFEDIRNSGDDHWAPSSGAAPASQQDAEPDEADDRDEDCDDNEASDDCDEYSPEPSRGKRPAPANRKDKGKNQRLQEGIGYKKN
ncbi:uncharacterized protein LOC112896297 [Panicum hallii]|uniref:uncharacterized protein LOC112896297 n=1 Tax=Panicum hallii TaxID=206008 RepID=UPI000DF4E610|nr:uncharacterized protein LOC112896297 [Panicum hallii]